MELLPDTIGLPEEVRPYLLAYGDLAFDSGGPENDLYLRADEAPLLVRSLLTAGVDTTVAAISAALYALATHPDQFALPREDPRRTRFAFEVAIRHRSPVQKFFRTAIRDGPAR